MSWLLAFVMTVVGQTKAPHCAVWQVGDDVVTCDGRAYPIGNVVVVHDRDDGDVIAVRVWR